MCYNRPTRRSDALVSFRRNRRAFRAEVGRCSLPESASAGGHAKSAIEAENGAIEHSILQDVLNERGELVRVAKA